MFTLLNSVQQSDGSFFESFTALSWKRENRRISEMRVAELRAQSMPVEMERDLTKEDEIETMNEREQLYTDVLYIITNSMGCQQSTGQVAQISSIHLLPSKY